MPIEIKELVIRTVVGSGAAPDPQDADDAAPPSRGLDAADLEALVQECVRQVLRVLDRRQER